MPVTTRPLTSSIGAVDRRRAARGDRRLPTRRAIRAALGEHGVLVFPGQDLTREQQVESTAHFGAVHGHPVPEFLFGAADPVAVVENDADKLPQEDQQFHVDYSFSTEIPDLAVLHAEVLPPNGGDTMWANAGAAYDALVTAHAGVPRRPDRAPRRRRQVLVGDASHAGGGAERARPASTSRATATPSCARTRSPGARCCS